MALAAGIYIIKILLTGTDHHVYPQTLSGSPLQGIQNEGDTSFFKIQKAGSYYTLQWSSSLDGHFSAVNKTAHDFGECIDVGCGGVE